MKSGEEKKSDTSAEDALHEDEQKTLALSPYPRLDIPEGEKPDLFSYLNSLPDVNLPASLTEQPLEGNDPPPPEKTHEQLKAEALAEMIRNRTRQSRQVTAYAMLLNDDPEIDKTLEMFALDAQFKDIVKIAGQKDIYYYSDTTMTSQFASLAVMLEEKDYLHTVAHMVRLHSKTHPAPTAEQHFIDPPYNYAKPHMQRIRRMIADDSRYADIKEFTARNGEVYLYSNEFLTEAFAFSLTDYWEELKE